jgi:glucan phosphoethanolaminetransferase (alkaline phosphatase superfamily)
VTWRLRGATVRRLAGCALALAPGAVVVIVDVGLRRSLLAAYTREAMVWYVGGAIAAAVGWAALVVAAARRHPRPRRLARVLLAALALLAVGSELQAWARYGAYLNWRTALMGCSLWPSLGQELWGDRVRALALLFAPVGVALGIAGAVARVAPPRRTTGRLALVIAFAAMGMAAAPRAPGAGWDSWSTPDVLWLNAAVSLARSVRSHEDVMVTLRWLPASRSPEPVPALRARPARPRSVLLIVDESVRAAEICSVPGRRCAAAPAVDALLPDRFGFTAMRALDSTTTLSIAALMTGLSPAERRERLLTAPMLPEFAHAAGIDTAFWTAQNLLFANFGRFLDGLPLTAFVSGTEIAPYATYETGADDEKLLDRALADMPRLREPYLAVVQLSNTHFPYVVDDRDTPFSSHGDWRRMDRFGQASVRYRDAIHRQDKLLARFLESLRARSEGARTVVIFLSDHGEQLGERGLIGHTWTVHDEEIRVPLWIDAPPGTLAEGEAAELRALQDEPLTMLDVAPTILDLLGLWDDPGIGRWRSRMKGVSLLREAPPVGRAVVMTNCSEIYSCSVKNWGAMRGTRKLIASESDGPWRCFDIANDPAEIHDLGAAACGDLQSIAEADDRGAPY